LPVRYRSAGERGWHYGVTASVSGLGAVIEGDVPESPESPLVCAISLPASAGCLIGRARIVRRDADSASFIIAVPRFRVERRAAAFSRFDRI
jgi:hypothetical protein